LETGDGSVIDGEVHRGAYEPAVAVNKATMALLAMTALATTNLRT
jgi:hypothetical protein